MLWMSWLLAWAYRWVIILIPPRTPRSKNWCISMSWRVDGRIFLNLRAASHARLGIDNSGDIFDETAQKYQPRAGYLGIDINRGNPPMFDSLWCSRPLAQTRTFLEGGLLQSSHCGRPPWVVNWFLQKHWNFWCRNKGTLLSGTIDWRLEGC